MILFFSWLILGLDISMSMMLVLFALRLVN